MAIDKLYREDREIDVQLGLLSVVLQVLQRHGECMLFLSKLLFHNDLQADTLPAQHTCTVISVLA